MSTLACEPQSECDLPLTEFQLGLERCVLKLNGKVKHCCRNAIDHLRKAWAIRRVDPEMAAFRAITAEEEAASALILSFQQKSYPEVHRLNHRNHVHKAAITPFLKAVRKVLASADFAEPVVRLDEGASPPTVNIRINMTQAGLKTPEPMFGQPDQPLNFTIRRGAEFGKIHMFEAELQEIALRHDIQDIIAFLRDEANTRNRLLYAGDQGIPKVEVPDAFFLERLWRVTGLLILTIAIQQTPIHQLFAVQCLQAFLRALGMLEGEIFEFGVIDKANGPGVFVTKEEDGEPTAWVGWQWHATIPFTYSFGGPWGQWTIAPVNPIDSVDHRRSR